MKKFFSLALSTVLLTGCFSSCVFADEAIDVKVNGKSVAFDAKPTVIDGRTWLPMSAIFSSFGCEVKWDAVSGSAVVTDPNSGIKATFVSGSKNVPYVQTGISKVASLKNPPFVKDGRTYLQLSVFAEIFCKDIYYDESTHTAIINDIFDKDAVVLNADKKNTVEKNGYFVAVVDYVENGNWVVAPNKNFVYCGKSKIGDNKLGFYFKALSYEPDTYVNIKRYDAAGSKVLNEYSYPLVVGNESNLPVAYEYVELSSEETSNVKKNDIVMVNLPQNSGSTGYVWTLEEEYKGLELVDKTVSGGSSMPGETVNEVWKFKVVEPGDYTLKFAYQRSWENESNSYASYHFVAV